VESQSNELDWDFYFFVAETLLNWNREEFLESTPNHLLKQFNMWLKYNNPKALHELEPKQVYTLDQTPFL
jgi:hypothetical protein